MNLPFRTLGPLITACALIGCGPSAQQIQEAETTIQKAEQRYADADARKHKAEAQLASLKAEIENAKAKLVRAEKVEQSHRALVQGQEQKAKQLRTERDTLREDLATRQYIHRARKAETKVVEDKERALRRQNEEAARQRMQQEVNITRARLQGARQGKKYIVDGFYNGDLAVKEVLPGGETNYQHLGVSPGTPVVNPDGTWGNLSSLAEGDRISVLVKEDGDMRIWILSR